MKPRNTSRSTALKLSWLVALILALLPFHAFLTVWVSSWLGHYTLLRLWKEILLAPVFCAALYWLWTDKLLRQKLFNSRLVRLIGIYAAWLLVVGIVALIRHGVNLKALAYGELVDLRYLFFFLMVLLLAARSTLLSAKWQKLVLVPSVIVVVFGLLQYYVLPYDFLRHFGYGPDTISPYETINHNLNYIRIESTLRGANPLGAYLVLVVSAGSALAVATKNKIKYCVFLGAALVALALTFSRSAWIGAALSLATILWLSLKSEKLRQRLLIGSATALVIICGLALALHGSTTFQDDILHTDNHSTATTSSNQGHASAFKNGVHDIVHQPLGGGVGSAGPQSAYNNHPGRLAENYFLQIGQEAGIIGMTLFIAINIMVGRLLWQRRSEPLALVLFASLIGLTFVNLLSHAWSDDTLAYIWWGLTGIALAPAILEHKGNKNGKKHQAPA